MITVNKTIRELLPYVDGTLLGREDDLDQVIAGFGTDSRQEIPNGLFVPLQGGTFDGHHFVDQAFANGACVTLWGKNTGINPPNEYPVILVDDTLLALHRWASMYLREINPKIIGITGSNGKTTTKDLTSSLLAGKYKVHRTAGNFNNLFGVPLTILNMPNDTEVAVLELGMNQKGEIESLSKLIEPDIGVITNVSETHIEYFGSIAGIAEAKLEIVAGMHEHSLLIYPEAERVITESPTFQSFSGEKKSYSLTSDTAHIRGRIVQELGFAGTVIEEVMTKEQFDIPIPGSYNASNALIALGIGRLLGLSTDEMRAGLQSVTRSNMRLEQLKGKHGSTLINDAYNASPISMEKSIDFFASLEGWSRKILVLGDMAELGEGAPAYHETIGELLDTSQFTKVFVTGKFVKHMIIGAERKGYDVEYVPNRDDLIEKLLLELSPETIMLFKASRSIALEEVIGQLIE